MVDVIGTNLNRMFDNNVSPIPGGVSPVVAVSRDGQRLCVQSSGAVTVLDAATLQPVATVPLGKAPAAGH